MNNKLELLRKHIRDVPDFPKPGILFKDVTPLLAAPEAFRATQDLFVEHYRPMKIQAVVGIESRGFIFGAPLALELGVPFHIVRKPGKLPYKTISVEYALEYGTGILHMHQDSIQSGQRVLVVDDLLATGGTAAATAQLVAKQGGTVVECAFVIELEFLQGREKIQPIPSFSLIKF